MSKGKSSILGYIFLGLAVVTLVLAIVGMCIPNVTGTIEILGHKETYNLKLFDDEWETIKKMYEASPTLSIVGFVCEIVGTAGLVAYLALKLFANKNIKILGLLSGIVALVGGVLAFVGAAVVAGKLNTSNGKTDNMQIYDPAVGAILGLVSGIVAVIVGGLSSSKKFN